MKRINAAAILILLPVAASADCTDLRQQAMQRYVDDRYNMINRTVPNPDTTSIDQCLGGLNGQWGVKPLGGGFDFNAILDRIMRQACQAIRSSINSCANMSAISGMDYNFGSGLGISGVSCPISGSSSSGSGSGSSSSGRGGYSNGNYGNTNGGYSCPSGYALSQTVSGLMCVQIDLDPVVIEPGIPPVQEPKTPTDTTGGIWQFLH